MCDMLQTLDDLSNSTRTSKEIPYANYIDTVQLWLKRNIDQLLGVDFNGFQSQTYIRGLTVYHKSYSCRK